MHISTRDASSLANEAEARAPDGTWLRARLDDAGVTVFISEGRWKRAPTDAKAVEGGARYLLVDLHGERRVARAVSTRTRS